jgi:hypothetical protein
LGAGKWAVYHTDCFENWRVALSVYLMAYGFTFHPVTGVHSSEPIFGRPVQLKLPDFCLQSSDVLDEGIRGTCSINI